MKDIKTILVGSFALGMFLLVGIQLHSMKSSQFTLKSRHRGVPVQPSSAKATKGGQEQPRYKSEIVWVKTSDGELMEIPQWQIDQMKVLQVLFVHQKRKNSKNNPINGSMINTENLKLMQKALNIAGNFEEFTLFCENLMPEQKANLINAAFTVEAVGLAALLAQETFSPEIQEKLGATVPGIIEPVVMYLLNHQDISKKIIEAPEYIKGISYIMFNPEGSFCSYAHFGLTKEDVVDLWDGKTGASIRPLQTKEEISTIKDRASLQLIGAGISHGGRYLAMRSVDHKNITDLYDRKTWENDKTWEKKEFVAAQQDKINYTEFSFDDKYLVSGTEDGALIIWNIATGEQIKILKGHQHKILCAAFSLDGKHIVSGSFGDHKLIVWDIATGDKKELPGHTAGITCVVFSPDGQFIVSGSHDDTVILWNAKTAELIRTLGKHNGSIETVAFSPDSQHIVSGSSGKDNNLILWTLVDMDTINFIKKELNISQARFLYRLYLAMLNKVPVILDKEDFDYQIYLTLPEDVQQLIKIHFPFEELSVFKSTSFEKAVQEKINDYKTKFIKVDASLADKIKTIKVLIKDVQNNPVEHEACKRLLHELEQEKAFENL